MKYSLLMMAMLLATGPLRAQDAGEGAPVGEMSPMMQQMQGLMEAMRQQMERIQSTEDPEEHQQLMREHMKSMHEGMGMMERMMGGSMGQQGSMPRCEENDGNCRMGRMETQQRTMGQRMGMMGMMMQQMTEHQMSHED